MKFFDKFILKIFSLIILIIAIVMILMIAGIVDGEYLFVDLLNHMTDGENNIKIMIGVLAVLILFAIKGFFFTHKNKDKSKEGITLENTSGKLVISKESLESLIQSVTRDIPGADTVSSKTILDKNKKIIVYVTAVVSKDVMIKDVSNELQKRVKEIMMRTADLEVKEVNIRIKNITSKKVKGLPSPKDEATENVVTDENTNEENSENEEVTGEE